jgi:small subunit ribosomal protein S17
MTQRGNRKTKIGRVLSDSMNKSRIIVSERSIQHGLYGKFIKKSSKFVAHDEGNESHVGDIVKIMETRPLSKRKRWRLVEIIEKAK